MTIPILDTLRYYPPSSAARFLHAYPRLTPSPPTLTLTRTTLRPLALLSVPYFATGLTITITLLIVTLCHLLRPTRSKTPPPSPSDSGYDLDFDLHLGLDLDHAARQRPSNCTSTTIFSSEDTVDEEANGANRESPTSFAFLPFSAFLTTILCATTALALSALGHVSAVFSATQQNLSATRYNITQHLHTPASTLSTYANFASQSAHAALTPLADAKTSFSTLLDSSNRILRFVALLDRYIHAAGVVLLVAVIILAVLVFLSLAAAVRLDFCRSSGSVPVSLDGENDDRLKKGRCCKILPFLLLLMPLFAAWATTAIILPIAVASGDFCNVLSTYNGYLSTNPRNTVMLKPTAQIFTRAFFVCPTDSPYAAALSTTRSLLASRTLLAPNVTTALDEAIPQSAPHADAWPTAITWLSTSLAEHNSCITMRVFTASASQLICSASRGGGGGYYGGGGAPGLASALADLWLCCLALALLLPLPVVLQLVKHPSTEHVTAVELQRLFGAPREMEAFGDVRSVVQRHSTFVKKEGGGDDKGVVDGEKHDIVTIEIPDPVRGDGVTSEPLGGSRRVSVANGGIDPSVVRMYQLTEAAMSVRRDPGEEDAAWYLGSQSSSSSSSSSMMPPSPPRERRSSVPDKRLL